MITLFFLHLHKPQLCVCVCVMGWASVVTKCLSELRCIAEMRSNELFFSPRNAVGSLTKCQCIKKRQVKLITVTSSDTDQRIEGRNKQQTEIDVACLFPWKPLENSGAVSGVR